MTRKETVIIRRILRMGPMIKNKAYSLSHDANTNLYDAEEFICYCQKAHMDLLDYFDLFSSDIPLELKEQLNSLQLDSLYKCNLLGECYKEAGDILCKQLSPVDALLNKHNDLVFKMCLLLATVLALCIFIANFNSSK